MLQFFDSGNPLNPTFPPYESLEKVGNRLPSGSELPEMSSFLTPLELTSSMFEEMSKDSRFVKSPNDEGMLPDRMF